MRTNLLLYRGVYESLFRYRPDSVAGRALLDVFDDERLDWRFPRVQLQADFLDAGKDLSIDNT